MMQEKMIALGNKLVESKDTIAKLKSDLKEKGFFLESLGTNIEQKDEEIVNLRDQVSDLRIALDSTGAATLEQIETAKQPLQERIDTFNLEIAAIEKAKAKEAAE